jgi:hypothetical protein
LLPSEKYKSWWVIELVEAALDGQNYSNCVESSSANQKPTIASAANEIST